MMTVLLILGKADISILIDAIDGGGVVVLDKLYEYNKEDCEDVLIQLIKQKISPIDFLFLLNGSLVLWSIVSLSSSIVSESTRKTFTPFQSRFLVTRSWDCCGFSKEPI